MTGTIHLQDARCDGSAHGGCQARCLLYWRKEWVEPAGTATGSIQPDAPLEDPLSDPMEMEDVPAVLMAATRGEEYTDDDPVYSCQATHMPNATCPSSGKDLRLWLKDVHSRNAPVRTAIVSFSAHAFSYLQILSRRWPKAMRFREGRTYPWVPVPTGEQRRDPPMHLQPGELVEVKSLQEIEATLNERNELRGLFFAVEMTPYCGKRARVLARVERIIDEKTGRMLKLRDCIIIEGFWCQGTYHFLCGRKIFVYWREAWLRRVEVAEPGASESARVSPLGSALELEEGRSTLR